MPWSKIPEDPRVSPHKRLAVIQAKFVLGSVARVWNAARAAVLMTAGVKAVDTTVITHKTPFSRAFGGGFGLGVVQLTAFSRAFGNSFGLGVKNLRRLKQWVSGDG